MLDKEIRNAVNGSAILKNRATVTMDNDIVRAVGSSIQIGQRTAIVTSIQVNQSPREFTKVILELTLPTVFGVSEISLPDILKDPATTKAIDNALRKFNFNE